MIDYLHEFQHSEKSVVSLLRKIKAESGKMNLLYEELMKKTEEMNVLTSLTDKFNFPFS